MGTYSTSEHTRQALIFAAGELVAERGVGQVSTRAIAQKAGENLGAIHYHFGGKDNLLQEMLRFACRDHTEPSLLGVIQAQEDRLHAVEGQVEAVRSLIRHYMRTVLSPERPRWCSRAIYQILQCAGPLRDFLDEQVLNSDFAAIDLLFKHIRPEWPLQEVRLWVYVVVGPIVFHTDHIETIMLHLDVKTFPKDYLEKLEHRLTDDALRALDLPTDVSVSKEERSS